VHTPSQLILPGRAACQRSRWMTQPSAANFYPMHRNKKSGPAVMYRSAWLAPTSAPTDVDVSLRNVVHATCIERHRDSDAAQHLSSDLPHLNSTCRMHRPCNASGPRFHTTCRETEQTSSAADGVQSGSGSQLCVHIARFQAPACCCPDRSDLPSTLSSNHRGLMCHPDLGCATHWQMGDLGPHSLNRKLANHGLRAPSQPPS
jgi:hypothetical protein